MDRKAYRPSRKCAGGAHEDADDGQEKTTQQSEHHAAKCGQQGQRKYAAERGHDENHDENDIAKRPRTLDGFAKQYGHINEIALACRANGEQKDEQRNRPQQRGLLRQKGLNSRHDRHDLYAHRIGQGAL